MDGMPAVAIVQHPPLEYYMQFPSIAEALYKEKLPLLAPEQEEVLKQILAGKMFAPEQVVQYYLSAMAPVLGSLYGAAAAEAQRAYIGPGFWGASRAAAVRDILSDMAARQAAMAAQMFAQALEGQREAIMRALQIPVYEWLISIDPAVYERARQEALRRQWADINKPIEIRTRTIYP